jgi:hypothetical protein
MLPGGFDVMSQTTQLRPRTSLMMRVAARGKRTTR